MARNVEWRDAETRQRHGLDRREKDGTPAKESEKRIHPSRIPRLCRAHRVDSAKLRLHQPRGGPDSRAVFLRCGRGLMFKYLDPYTLRAHLSPAIIAAAPAFAAVALLISWTQFSLSNTIATAGLVALLCARANMARSRGKKIEPQIYAELGGMPSISMLRHSDTTTFDPASRARYVAFLAGKINETVPTEAEEKANPEAADAFYGRCGQWLRENTRNTKKFNIL